MTRSLAVIATTALCTLLAGAAAAQQEPGAAPPSKAERISDRAIASLAGWKTKPAENLLASNQKELGTTPEYLAALGLLRATEGKGDEAVRLLEDAMKANPSDYVAPFYLGEVHYWRQASNEATKAWRTARDRAKAQVDAAGTNARAQYYLGSAQVRLKQFGPARSALEAAGEHGYDPILVDYQTGLSFALQERWQDAIKALDAVAEKDPKFAPLYFYRGLSWGQLDRTDKMLVDMDQFVKLAPKAPEAAVAKTYLAAAQR